MKNGIIAANAKAAEHDGEKILAQAELPAVVKAAKAKEARQEAAAAAHANRKKMVAAKHQADAAAALQAQTKENNAKAYVRKQKDEKATDAHEEKALKKDLKHIQQQRRAKVKARKAAIHGDVKKLKQTSKAERSALGHELSSMDKGKASLLKKMKNAVAHNVRRNALHKQKVAAQEAAQKQKKNAKKQSAEQALKADLRKINAKKTNKISAAKAALQADLQTKGANNAGSVSMDDLLDNRFEDDEDTTD